MSSYTGYNKTTHDETNGQTDFLIEKIPASDLGEGCIVDGKIKVSADDSSPGYIEDKIVVGDDVVKTTLNGGGNETFKLYTNGKARVSNTDTTYDYLDNKLEVGDYLKKTITGTGADENIEFDLKLSSFMGNHLGWVLDIINSASTRDDETEFDALSTRLNPINLSYKNIQFIEDVSSAAGSMGTIENIGSTTAMSTALWERIHGLLFVYNCQGNNWFNIKHNGTATDSDCKPILTGTGADVKFVKKALFCYDKDDGRWHLLSWTRATWGRQNAITSTSGNSPISIDVCFELPQAGYYHFDAFVTVSEKTAGVFVETEDPQELTVYSSTESKLVDLSGFFIPSDLAPSIKWTNLSLQGSGIIYEGGAEIANRIIGVSVLLPNGEVKTVESGYIHLIYLGEMIYA